MDDELTMEELLKQQDEKFSRIKVGKIVIGKINNVYHDRVELELEDGFDGIITIDELNIDENQYPCDVFKVGDKIDAVITKFSQKDGTIKLSKLQSDKREDLAKVKQAFDENKIITVNVIKNIDRGVFANYNTFTFFIPISQLDTKFVDDTSKYVGLNLEVYIKEMDLKRNRCVASHRAVLQERKDKERAYRKEQIRLEKKAEKEKKKMEKEEFFMSLEVGQRKSGKVTKLMPYGAFVNVGGFEGLVHITNLSWVRVNTVEEVLKEGQDVDVYIIDIDRNTKKLGFALKDINNDPWEIISKEVKVDDIVDAKVLRIIERAAFVQIKEGVDAYLPIYELSDTRVAKVTNVVNVGDEIKVKILEFKPKSKRMVVSIKEATREPEEDISEFLEVEESLGSLGDLFKDKFKDINLQD